MIRRKILYLFILAVWCWLVMLYNFQELRFLLAILLCVPLLCLILVLPQRRKTELELKGIPEYVTRGESIRLRAVVTYKGRLPLAGFRIKGIWRAWGVKTLRVESMVRGLGGRSRREIEFTLPAEHCGSAEFTVKKAVIYDCLRLFSVSVSSGKKEKVLVTPRLEPVPEHEVSVLLNLLRMRAVSDEGEPFVREYRFGDSPRSIHWKLTAKEDELQVRDIDPDRQISLFLNLTDRLREQPEQRDFFLDRACSLMAFLADVCKDQAVVCWMQDGILHRNRIREPEDIYPCIRKLILVKRAGVADPRDPAVQGMLAGCHLEEDGRLYLGEQCIDEE